MATTTETTTKETSYGYIQATSTQGTTYAIGYPAGQIPATPATPANAEGEITLMSKRTFEVDVHWPVDGWHQTTDQIRSKTGINSYDHGKSSSPFYDYYMEIHVAETYNFWFADEEGDTYNLNTWTQGLHIFRYNSKKPTIVRVKGN